MASSEDYTAVDEYESYMSDTELEYTPELPTLETTFASAICVMNLPKVDATKLEKLTNVVKKFFSKVGVVDETTKISMPMDKETGITYGFAYVNFQEASDADKAITLTNGVQFDKSHKLIVTKYDEVIRLEQTSKDYTVPTPPPYKKPVDTSEWLLDESQRDSFCIRHGPETAVYWTDGTREPTVDYDGAREKSQGIQWCNYYMQWSARGSYMATIVPAKGVIVWGGINYDKLSRFAHSGVETVSFSPCENYLMSNNYNSTDKGAVKIFNVKTGKLLREFALFPENMDATNRTEETVAPKFQWSPNDEYIARQSDDMITVYELPSMKILNKRSIVAEGIFEFSWSPKDNVIAYWAPEKGNAPAHVDLIEIPSRKKLRQKNLFNVTNCLMSWQSEGAFLGIKVLRHTKSKKTLYNNFELFRVHDAGIPVEMLDVKDAVMAFGWEPNGTRFAFVHAENISATRTNVSFYDMNKTVDTVDKKGKKTGTSTTAELTLVETLTDRQCNQLYWNPAGGVIVMAGLGENASGTLEFYDVNAMESMAMREHYRATEVCWDPSGRTLSTCVIQPITGGYFKFQMDNGYNIWSFQGKQLHQQSFENFYQFSWRPRAQLLDSTQRKEVVKNIKKYEKKFDKADKDRARLLYLEETKEKRALRSDFRNRLAQLKDFYARQKSKRMELNGGYDSDDDSNYQFETVTHEVVISTTETVVDRW